jgi:hypothetical protein
VGTSEVMLGLVAIGSLLTLVYLFIEFVWWSPTTNDRRHTAALDLRKLYKKLHASGAKQLDERGLTWNEQEGASVASLKTDLVIPLAIRADNRFEKTASSAAHSSLTSAHQNSLRNVGTQQATGLSSR